MPNSEEKLLSTLESDIERVEQALQQLDALAAESLDTAEVQSRINVMMNEFEMSSTDPHPLVGTAHQSGDQHGDGGGHAVPEDHTAGVDRSDLSRDRGFANQHDSVTQGE